MTGRKKGLNAKCRGDRVQVHATFTFQADPSCRKDSGPVGAAAGGDSEARDKESRGGMVKVSASGSKVVSGERLSFADHAIKILDQMMKERSVGELLKLGPREEMLGLTPLSMAAAVGHVEGTRKLLEAGAGVDDKSSDGSTALLNAAQWRHLPVLDLLLHHGANVAATNNDGNNVLMVALRHGDVRAVNSVWPHRRCLDINHSNNEGYTAIHLAAERKWESCVQFLIQNGADVNKQNNNGLTALHIAAAKGDHATAERLLTAGANILAEDNFGNDPFCLAVRGFHDSLANYFLDQLRTEDKLYFCKRRVHGLTTQLPLESCNAWSALAFLISDTSLRDALYHSEVMRVIVHVLGRRGLMNEVAVQSCLVCSDLMYNPFPSPDDRFVRQFLVMHGPEAVLDRLDSRGNSWGQEHGLELSRELTQLQAHLQGQPQSRQQQIDFNTAFILLPLMAMAETRVGKTWYAETTNQQRIAGHLRRVSSYRELLQMLSVVQQETDGQQVKVDRVAVVERFMDFFGTLENRDCEEKVRQLLEQEEREKTRKVKKREKKRQQRLKQRLKSKANDTPVNEPVAGNKEMVVVSEPTKIRTQTLDALDDIPLTVGPDGVQDVSSPAAALAHLALAQDFQGNDDEWVMVGGKRCYPPKTRSSSHSVHTFREEQPREHCSYRTMEAPRSPISGQDALASSSNDDQASCMPLRSYTQIIPSWECDFAERSEPVKRTVALDVDFKVKKGGGKRWADVARNRNVSLHQEEASWQNDTEPESTADSKLPVQTMPSKEEYHEQFPSLRHEPSADAATPKPLSMNKAKSEEYNSEIMGAAHQFLEILCSTGLRADGSPEQECTTKDPANVRIDPSVLYEALTGWMWQAAIARGLITPDTDPSQFFTSKEFVASLASQFLKPYIPATSQCNPNLNTTTVAGSPVKSSSGSKLSTNLMHTPRIEQCAVSKQSSTSTSARDRSGAASKDTNDTCVPKSQLLTDYTSIPTLPSQADVSQTGACESVADGSANSQALGNATNIVNSAGFSQTTDTGQDISDTGLKEKDTFLLTGSDFNHWLSSGSASSADDGASTSLACRKPFPESSDSFGQSFTPSLDTANTVDVSIQREQQPDLDQANDLPPSGTNNGSIMTHSECQEDSHTTKKSFQTGSDAFKQIPVFGSMTDQEKAALNKEYDWLLQDPVKARMKTAVVSVPPSRSSDSVSAQSSSSEQRNEMVSDDIFSIRSDTSRSSCLNDSCHQLYPGDMGASTSSGVLHECLAPGFIRAASGDIRQRSYTTVYEDTDCRQEVKPDPLAGILGNMGCFNFIPDDPEDKVQKTLDSQYPDLSVVPERKQSLTFHTQLPKAMRVVGHGRPLPSQSPQLDAAIMSHSSPDLSVNAPNQANSLKGGAAALASSASATTASAASAKNASSDSITSTATFRQGTGTAERPASPDVLFPESLREGESTDGQIQSADIFPSIHDMMDRDLFQDVFSNSYFLEQIAIDQIRRRLRALGCGREVLKANSVLFHDLDYYASLYGVRLRDILGPSVAEKPAGSENGRLVHKLLDQSMPAWKAVVKELGRRMNSKEDLREAGDLELSVVWEDPVPASEWPWTGKVTAPQIVTEEANGEEGWWQECGGSRRWRKWLQQILDLPWTMRRQFGKIVLPARSMEFNIGRTGHHPLILGFLTDGMEVGVLALDRSRHALDTRLMATVAADSEPDVHFVLRYKAVWECAGRVYLAMELCDYTLDEYVSIVRLDHSQDPLSTNRLAWQLLKGLKYLHSNFAVAHGNLMPAWVFVDCDGRLRLAGYGLRDVTACAARAAGKEQRERCSIGDTRYWRATEYVPGSAYEPSFQGDIQVAGMLLHYILTGGRHPYGDTGPEVEANLSRNAIRQQRVSQEADHLVSLMTLTDPTARPTIDACLRHPFFWSGEKRFRLVLIVGSDILTEMKTGVPLTGAGCASMVDILSVVHINTISENWLGDVDPTVVKEMRAFRQYKNNLPELVLFVYNCCLHYDKMSAAAKEVLDDPCKYFQNRFTGLFMAVYRAMRASDRTDRTCYKPFF